MFSKLVTAISLKLYLVFTVNTVIGKCCSSMTDDFSLENTELKVAFLGGPGVGKTSLINALANCEFEENPRSSVGQCFFKVQCEHEGRKVGLQLWDTAGEERYQNTISAQFFRDSDVIVGVFSLSETKSQDDLERWLETAGQYIDIRKVKLIIVGNKQDLPYDAQLGTSCHIAYGTRISYLTTSAKTGFNVDVLMEAILKCPSSNKPSEDVAKVERTDQGENRKKCCS